MQLISVHIFRTITAVAKSWAGFHISTEKEISIGFYMSAHVLLNLLNKLGKT